MFAKLRQLTSRHPKIVVACVVGVGALAGGAVALSAAASESSILSDAELAAVGRLAVDFCRAGAIAVTVPKDALPTVRQRQAAVAAAGRQPVQAGETHTAILPEDVKRRIDANYRAAMSEVLTAEFLARHVDGQAAAGEGAGESLDVGLYNNPEDEPCVGCHFALTDYLKCKGEIGGDPVVWVQVWEQGVTSNGPRIEGWEIWELRVSKTAAGWRIADARILFIGLSRDPSQWGPDSPHDPPGQGERGAPSLLYSNRQLTPADF